jgi:hypothetical protein
MAVGANRLNRQDLGDLGAARRRSVDTSFETSFAESRANAALSDAVVYVPVDRQLLITVANQGPRLARPERPSTAEKEHSLQEARLSGAIRTKEVVSRSVEVELDFLETPKRADP